MPLRNIQLISVVLVGALFSFLNRVPATELPAGHRPSLRAGASAIDVSPAAFPVLVNGGFLQNSATKVNDPLFAKCLVLDDGSTRLAIVVVDSCMMPRDMLDKAKALASAKTGIATERMLIAATHTHSAPASMGALGCPADPAYVAFLPDRIAESIASASANLAPARIGWGVVDDHLHTFCRRWIRRSDRMIDDPFGKRTVRANMHPGYVNPDAIAPAGPVDPALTVLSVQSADGKPLAVLANYSMHYYGSPPVSGDYFGRFAAAFTRSIGAGQGSAGFVAMMSQGTSGDQMWMDYGRPKKDPGLDRYSDEVAQMAHEMYRKIEYRDHAALAMAESTLSLARRTPDDDRLKWARDLVAKMGERVPRTIPEVYAKEALYLHEQPRRELKLQAIRIGDMGITAIPNEVFAITGLKLKARSPLTTTMNIELANGSEGYIPPPEQHVLGGYTTWPARTAALEVQAEPRIVETVLTLLERVAGRPRREDRPRATAYSQHVLASRPSAYWRLEELDGTVARDQTGRENLGLYEPGVAFHLPGPDHPGFHSGSGINRAGHLAGGRIMASLVLPAEFYTVEFWFWNGLPNDAHPITGHLLECGSGPASGDILGLTGSSASSPPGQLFFVHGRGTPLIGKTQIEPKTWHHVVLVRAGRRVTIHLDGQAEPEIVGDANPDSRQYVGNTSLTIGGRQDSTAGLEGKLDEIAVYDRALTTAEVVEHFRAAIDQRDEAFRK